MNPDFIKQKLDFIKNNCKTVLNVGAGAHDGFRAFFNNLDYKTTDIIDEKGVDIVADAHQLPIKDQSFDAVLSFSLLEHVHSPQIVADHIFRILKPGGYALISTPFIHPYHGGNCPDYYRFTKDGLRYLFRNFSSIETASDGGFFYALQFFVPSRLRSFDPIIKPILRWLDRRFTNGRASVHQVTIFAKKS